VRKLAIAADRCWEAILKKDVAGFGKFLHESFKAQTALFPAMATANVRAAIRLFSDVASGWKLAGAGGGGYLVLVSEQEIPSAIKIKIRRKETFYY
jgi:galactokinase/mevalonate kinase-like predicted kinase